MISLADARREVLGSLDHEQQQKIAQELLVDASLVPGHLKVSCPFGGCSGVCRSPSKRDSLKPKKAWVCGSNFSHDDRMERCVSYRRLHFGLRDGVSGNRRFRK